MSKQLCEDIAIHDNLNPKLWDKENHLLPEVREKLIEIVHAFEEYIDMDLRIVDVQLVGSNASYNYTENSDVDCHIIANFEYSEVPREYMQTICDMKKTAFNKDTDIKIRGMDVEMYIQDIRSSVMSNGIYSVCDDEWVKEPKPLKTFTKHNNEDEVNNWQQKIMEVLNSGDYEDISNCIDALYLMRANSIANDGEYGVGNQTFKDIRNLGLLDQLKERRLEVLSRQLSLEHLEYGKGDFINRFVD